MKTCVINLFICQLSRYYDTYLPFLLEACNDETPDVRQVRIRLSLLLRILKPFLLFKLFDCWYWYFLAFLQAAVYGLGVCAEFGGSVFKPLVGGTA